MFAFRAEPALRFMGFGDVSPPVSRISSSGFPQAPTKSAGFRLVPAVPILSP